MLPTTRLYPLVAAAGVLLAVIAFVVGEASAASLTDLGRSPLAPGAPAGPGLLLAGVAALAVVGGMRAVGAPWGGWPERLTLVWAGAVTLLAVAPQGAPDLVVTGLSVAALLSLPIAAGLLVPAFAADERWRPLARPMEWLALAGGLSLVGATYVALPGHQALLGLVERVLLAIEVAAVGALAVRLLGLTWGVAVSGVLDRMGAIERARSTAAAIAARAGRGTKVLG